jgi:hypothetical protein
MTPEEIKYDDWGHMTPIGGKFDWENNQIHGGVKYQAAITIVPTADAPFINDDELFLDIDRALDDGDPDNGNFRRGDGGFPLFIIEN